MLYEQDGYTSIISFLLQSIEGKSFIINVWGYPKENKRFLKMQGNRNHKRAYTSIPIPIKILPKRRALTLIR